MPRVRQWLVSLGLAQYADAFDENAIGWEVLPDLDHHVLKDVGVSAAGDRLRILKADLFPRACGCIGSQLLA
jgi:hypothetical protein